MKKMLKSAVVAAAVVVLAATTARAQEKDIVDTAVAAGSFKTLAAALTAGDLVQTLKGKGPFTVFAPTDEAFAKLPAATLADLLKPENKAKLAGHPDLPCRGRQGHGGRRRQAFDGKSRRRSTASRSRSR